MGVQRYSFFCCGCGANAAAGDRAEGDEADGDLAAAFDGGKPLEKGAEPALRALSWAQVEAMTGGFTSAVVGEGGFSTVYLARLSGGDLAAVKVHRSSDSERLHRVFRQELDALLRLRHPHIVRLLAFCDQQEEGVLVLEFAANGNLHERLHGGGKAASAAAAGSTMPWARRVAVALQVARALEHLHDACEPQVVHGDVKASNVLLDAAMAAKLCDFGAARMGFSAAVRQRSAAAHRTVLGSPGYVDPHYIRSGVLTTKSDVYSFGVLLLELLTGMEPFCAAEGRLLTAVLAPRLRAGGDARGMVDERLGTAFDADEAAAVAALAVACVGENPSLRPSMADVVRTLEQSAQGSISAVGSRSDGHG